MTDWEFFHALIGRLLDAVILALVLRWMMERMSE
jgi:hypothetical protein